MKAGAKIGTLHTHARHVAQVLASLLDLPDIATRAAWIVGGNKPENLLKISARPV